MLVRVALPVALHRSFDYLAPAVDDPVGRCVRVRFGPRRMVGVVIDVPEVPAVDPASLVTIDGFIEGVPAVPADVQSMARFAADYYQHPLGMALQHAVPPRARQPMS